jgi:ketosteroid isomerase-like protein
VIDERAWLAAWDKPDYEAISALSAEDLEVTAVTASIEPRHCTGSDAAVRWLTELRDRLRADWSATNLERLDGDTIVVQGELCFADPATIGAARQSYAVLMRLREDKVRWIGTFVTPQAAREAWELGVGA